jgi:hypothetical protein
MKFLRNIIISALFAIILSEDCSNLNGEYGCYGDQKEYPPD